MGSASSRGVKKHRRHGKSQRYEQQNNHHYHQSNLSRRFVDTSSLSLSSRTSSSSSSSCSGESCPCECAHDRDPPRITSVHHLPADVTITAIITTTAACTCDVTTGTNNNNKDTANVSISHHIIRCPGLRISDFKVVRLKVSIDKKPTSLDERSNAVLKYRTPHFRSVLVFYRQLLPLHINQKKKYFAFARPHMVPEWFRVLLWLNGLQFTSKLVLGSALITACTSPDLLPDLHII